MKKIQYIIAGFAALLLTNCNTDETLELTTETSNTLKVVNLSDSEGYIGKDLGVYSNEFGYIDNLTIRTKATSVLVNGNVQTKAFSNATDVNEILNLPIKFNKIKIGDMELVKMKRGLFASKSELNSKNSKIESERISSRILQDFFSKKTTFNIENSIKPIKEELYIPKPIFVNSQLKAKSNSGNPIGFKNRSNFTFEYNSDANNKNGVLILLSWSGEKEGMSFNELGHLDMNKRIQIAIFEPEDNGYIHIPNGALTKFPENAILTVKIMRGNSKTVSLDDETDVYITNMSEYYKRIILTD